MTGICPVDRHMDNRAYRMTINIRNPQLIHQLVIAGCHFRAVHSGNHAASADLLDICHPAAVNLFSIRFLQASADRMRRSAFRQSRVFDQFFIFQFIMMDAVDFKYTLSQRSRLIKYHNLRLGQRLQIIGAFHQNAGIAGPAYSREKAQRNTDHQCARAADYQECQRAVDPGAPVSRKPQREHPHQRRQECQRQSRIAYRRRIDPGKFADKVLGPGFSGTGIFHQIQDPGHRRLSKFLRGPDLQHAGHIDAAADDLISCPCIPRQTLSRQRAGIQAGRAFYDDTVDGHFLAGLYHNHASDLHFVRIHLLQPAVPFHIRVIRADIHQFADISPALAHRVALEPLAHLIEQHNGNCFCIIPAPVIERQRNRADGRHRHQEILIKYLAVLDPF